MSDTSKLEQLLQEYGQSHQDPVNKVIHWIMVPLIYLAITALLWGIEITSGINLATVICIPVMIYYLSLSPKIGIGMALFTGCCLVICFIAEQYLMASLWKIAVAIFVTAWIFQFVGHQIEGKKPSFLKDLQFLLIGPAWLMSALYGRMGIRL